MRLPHYFQWIFHIIARVSGVFSWLKMLWWTHGLMYDYIFHSCYGNNNANQLLMVLNRHEVIEWIVITSVNLLSLISSIRVSSWLYSVKIRTVMSSSSIGSIGTLASTRQSRGFWTSVRFLLHYWGQSLGLILDQALPIYPSSCNPGVSNPA